MQIFPGSYTFRFPQKYVWGFREGIILNCFDGITKFYWIYHLWICWICIFKPSHLSLFSQNSKCKFYVNLLMFNRLPATFYNLQQKYITKGGQLISIHFFCYNVILNIVPEAGSWCSYWVYTGLREATLGELAAFGTVLRIIFYFH